MKISDLNIGDKVIINSAYYGWATAEKGDIAIVTSIESPMSIYLTLPDGRNGWQANLCDIELYEEPINKIKELRELLIKK